MFPAPARLHAQNRLPPADAEFIVCLIASATSRGASYCNWNGQCCRPCTKLLEIPTCTRYSHHSHTHMRARTHTHTHMRIHVALPGPGQTNFCVLLMRILFIYCLPIFRRRQCVHLGSVPLKCLQFDSVSPEFW